MSDCSWIKLVRLKMLHSIMVCLYLVFEQWLYQHTKKSEVTHTRNLCSVCNPSKWCARAHTHTHRAVGSHLCCGTRGAVGGSVPCSRAAKLWYWGWVERALYINSPHLQFLPVQDSNSQPLDYESDSLTIRPQLAQLYRPTCLFICFMLSFHKISHCLVLHSSQAHENKKNRFEWRCRSVTSEKSNPGLYKLV